MSALAASSGSVIDRPAAEAPDAEESQSGDAVSTRLIESELLVEEISIDGMCGVY